MCKFKGENLIDFGKVFQYDSDCKEYLSELKWKNGFVCTTKCGHTFGYKKSKYNYYCYKCHHIDRKLYGGNIVS